MSRPKFTMPFEPMTIEHLGLRLYSTLPPVVTEFVTNAYDAESPTAKVTVPTETITPESEVVIRDRGHGMTATELQDEFLPIGRNRRGEKSEQVMSKHGKVRVTGRKGLGKLSGFGVADVVEIRSVKSGEAVTLRLSYPAMRDWTKDHPGTDYEPEVVEERSGSTDDPDGVEVTLRRLRRKRRINPDALRKSIARRLTSIGPRFQVYVNGTPIQPGDRMDPSACIPGGVWKAAELPHGNVIGQDLAVEGWIGFVPKSSQVDRGVDVFATDKAVELGSYFLYPSTHAQYARAYLVGEVHADFLDDEGEDGDHISTARNSVVWESSEGQLLREWGHKTLKWAFARWVELRREEKEEKVIRARGFDKWLERRPSREQKVAKRMVKLLVEDESLEPESAGPLLDIIKSSVETVAFRDLLEVMEEEVTAAALLRLFEEWRVIEAREHLQLADGRMSALLQLEKYIEKGALEVQEMQPLLASNPWLIDQSWKESDVEQTYTKLLREQCPEPGNTPEEDRRIDILGITAGHILYIVELKRPEKTLNRRDLEQVESYVDWARSNIVGSGPHAPRYAHGLLIGGRHGQKSEYDEKVRRLQGDDIRVETYRDLYSRGREQFAAVEQRLKTVAPEYSRARRRGAAQKNGTETATQQTKDD